MATASRTYGNTLSELQAGTNADKAITYSRQNAEDTTSQQRLEAFLRLRGQELEAKAKQADKAADRAHNLKLGEMDAKSRLEVARATAEGRTSPKAEELKLALQQEEIEKQSLTDARKKIIDEMQALEIARKRWDIGDPNDIGADWTSTQYGKLRDALSKIDAYAADKFGIFFGPRAPSLPVVPLNPTPAPPNAVPAMLNQPIPVTTPQGSAWMGMGGMLPSSANQVVAPAPVPPMLNPSPLPPAPVNRFYKGPDGQWIPRTGY